MIVNCSDTLEHLLDGRGVTNEGGGHLDAHGGGVGGVADRRLDLVGDPFNQVGRVLVLDVEHCSSTSLVDMQPWNMSAAVR